MKLIGIWEDGFLDLSGTHHYRQRGEQMPQIEGTLLPGLDEWRWAYAGSFDEPDAIKPPRGPLDEQFMRYEGYSLTITMLFFATRSRVDPFLNHCTTHPLIMGHALNTLFILVPDHNHLNYL